MKKITIAIDGHSSCGKSTMAKDLARRIGYVYIDTGAMYRAVTLFAMRHNLIANGQVDAAKLQEEMAIYTSRFVSIPKRSGPTHISTANVWRGRFAPWRFPAT